MSPAAPWKHSVELRAFNSFGVPATAQRLAICTRMDELRAALSETRDAPGRLLLGGGSNLLFVEDPSGPVIQPLLSGLEFGPEREGTVEVVAAAGEPWDHLVRRCCERGLWGLENLALIPGSVGAAPVQNIGAYGAELADSLRWVEVLDAAGGARARMPKESLALGYRDSLFKQQPDRWVIVALGLELHLDARPRLGYSGLAQALADTVDPTPLQVADAVSALRRSKLPEPAQLGNAGSFFKNPEIPLAQAEPLMRAFPALPVFPGRELDQIKLSAAWLIEHLGWKGARRGDAGIAPQHALVLVNHGTAKGAELLALAREVAQSVLDEFRIRLVPEPKILGAEFWDPQ